MNSVLRLILAGVILFCNAVIAQEQWLENLPVCEGKYQPTDESLKQKQCPDWFRDAKFGIWSVWGPQAVARQGEWYARQIYTEDQESLRLHWKYNKDDEPSAQYKYHRKHYGHPSEFGYKDIIPLWTGEKWDPEALMKLYKRAGAKYFVSIAIHHDNFSLWNSQLNRWNSVNMGPKKDVIKRWQQAAQKEGLPFGVTEHLGASYTWFQYAHGSDKTGEKAGVPYDGNNPDYWDLYHEPAQPDDNGWLTKNPKWQRNWYDRIQELVDNYHPDLLYSDSELPFGNVGRNLIAHYYNSAEKHNPHGVVYTCKTNTSDERWLRDYERCVDGKISKYPWQTDTSIGDWIYRADNKNYKSATEIIQMLVDIVSKNGNLLLDVLQTPEGDVEDDVVQILTDIGDWMQTNGEAIYGTRPWKTYGEGPSVTEPQEKSQYGGIVDFRKYTAADLRFTQKENTLYCFCMEKPDNDVRIKSLGLKAPTGQKIASISMLGSKKKIKSMYSTTAKDFSVKQKM
jgi:alpha-L-fucosidase